MSSQTPNLLIKCAGPCGEEKTPDKFYHKNPVCRGCILAAGAKPGPKGGPQTIDAVAIEKHRQEKILRQELKKIARKRLDQRNHARKAKAKKKAVEELIPAYADLEKNEVDPVLKELAQRELSRRRLIEFIQEFHPRYKAGWVHHDICRRLEKFAQDVAAGLSPRLMILMPPRHGKSQIASKLFPAWVMGHYNYFEIIACSYNVSLALDFSREVRGVVESDRYHLLFPDTKVNQEARGAEAWRLMSPTGVGTGGYVAAGIGGAINGKGAHILIIDDPIKNAEEADSPEHRTKIWDWYGSTAYTRLAPGAGVLVIQTWWHDDDLAGRLQEAMKDNPEADQFEIIKYPAIATEDEEFRLAGEPLHPERYDLAALMRIKNQPATGARWWSALYQQDPVPAEGAYFTKDMLVDRVGGLDPTRLHIYQAWDFAISDKKQNDWNVGVTVGLDYDDTEHVLEVVRFKTTDAGKICDEILDMHERWDKVGSGVKQVGAEDGQIWRTMQALLAKRMTERRQYPSFEVLKPLTDKMVRARPLQGRLQAKKVTFPKGAAWMDPLRKEFLRFPAGIHDDIVDALAWVTTLVIGKAPPAAPVYKGKRREMTLEEQIRRLGLGVGGGRSAMSA